MNSTIKSVGPKNKKTHYNLGLGKTACGLVVWNRNLNWATVNQAITCLNCKRSYWFRKYF